MFIASAGLGVAQLASLEGITTNPNAADRVNLVGGNLVSAGNAQVALSPVALFGPQIPQPGALSGVFTFLPLAPANSGPLTQNMGPGSITITYESSVWSLDANGLFTLKWSFGPGFSAPFYVFPQTGAIGSPMATELFFSDDVQSPNYAARFNLYFLCP